jgi:hypothetical protein
MTTMRTQQPYVVISCAMKSAIRWVLAMPLPTVLLNTWTIPTTTKVANRQVRMILTISKTSTPMTLAIGLRSEPCQHLFSYQLQQPRVLRRSLRARALLQLPSHITHHTFAHAWSSDACPHARPYHPTADRHQLRLKRLLQSSTSKPTTSPSTKYPSKS